LIERGVQRDPQVAAAIQLLSTRTTFDRLLAKGSIAERTGYANHPPITISTSSSSSSSSSSFNVASTTASTTTATTTPPSTETTANSDSSTSSDGFRSSIQW
jgi:hypothetical protein